MQTQVLIGMGLLAAVTARDHSQYLTVPASNIVHDLCVLVGFGLIVWRFVRWRVRNTEDACVLIALVLVCAVPVLLYTIYQLLVELSAMARV